MAQKGGEFMKSRTLVIVTAAILTCAAVLLTSGLSLLYGSAFDTATADEAPGATVDQAIADMLEDLNNKHTEGISPEVISPEPPVDPPAIGEILKPVITPDIMDYPDFEYTLGDPRDIYVGGNYDNDNRGVVIDIYSHKTGKLVGQLSFTSTEISDYIGNLVRKNFQPANEAFDPHSDDEPVNLPKGDYRIEVYAGTWFSYTYGQHDLFELTQCTLTFTGGAAITGYIDYLIADYIAEIEAGNVEAPDPEMAISKLEYAGLEGYWEGYYNDVCNMYIPGAGRWTERFPYIED